MNRRAADDAAKLDMQELLKLLADQGLKNHSMLPNKLIFECFKIANKVNPSTQKLQTLNPKP
jgi:hypothetical protein